jgi:hypothetical protein
MVVELLTGVSDLCLEHIVTYTFPKDDLGDLRSLEWCRARKLGMVSPSRQAIDTILQLRGSCSRLRVAVEHRLLEAVPELRRRAPHFGFGIVLAQSELLRSHGKAANHICDIIVDRSDSLTPLTTPFLGCSSNSQSNPACTTLPCIEGSYMAPVLCWRLSFVPSGSGMVDPCAETVRCVTF